MLKDVKVYLVQNPKDIQQAIREVRPHYMSNVPRFWEKVALGINEKIAAMSPFKRAMVTWAMAIGESYNIDYLRLDKCPPLKLKLSYKFADKFIFGLVKKTVGIENGKMFPTAGAYMDSKLIKFFRCMGIPITFGYGLTETFATVSCFDYKGYKFGTIGTVMPASLILYIKLYKNFGEIFPEIFHFIVTIFSFFVFCAFVSGLRGCKKPKFLQLNLFI